MEVVKIERPNGPIWEVRHRGWVAEVFYDTDDNPQDPCWVWRGQGPQSSDIGGDVADSRKDAIERAKNAIRYTVSKIGSWGG